MIARVQVAEPSPIAGHLGQARTPTHRADLDFGIARDHDGSIGKRVGADRRHDQQIQSRIHDRSAAGQRIGGRARGGRDHDAIAAVRVQVTPVHQGLKIEHVPGFATQQHDIVEGQMLRDRPLAALQARFEERSPVGRAASIKHGLDAGLDIRGAARRSGNPSRPRLIPSSGTSRPTTSRAACSKVPSPPTATM